MAKLKREEWRLISRALRHFSETHPDMREAPSRYAEAIMELARRAEAAADATPPGQPGKDG